MCEYCQPDYAGNMRPLRDSDGVFAYLEEFDGGWVAVTHIDAYDQWDVSKEASFPVRNCPMCGRDLMEDEE